MIRVSTADLYLTSNESINLDQSQVMNSVAQLSSGKQVNSPADNPVGAAQAASLQSNITGLGQYQTNQNQATQLLNSASSTVTQVVNLMQSVRTALVEAGNGAMSDSDRAAIASQLQQSLNQLVGLANTSDAQGGYLFGGSRNGTAPFVQGGNAVSYVGDNLGTGVQIASNRTEQVKYSGSSVFLSVPSGNGTFVTGTGTNTGNGTINAGSVVAPGQLTGDSYKISIGAGGAYSIVDNKTGGAPVNGAGSGTLNASGPTTISFDGMQMTISGTQINPGDTFTVAPSTNQSMFGILASAISALNTPSSTPAIVGQRTNAISAALGNVDQTIGSLSTTQAAMGSQLQELNTYNSINASQTLQDQTQMSSIVDLNYANAASLLAQQQTQFQAALQSYSAVSKLSLFNYL